MSSDLPDLRGEFLDDFYTECDELLGNIRTQLSALDDARKRSRPDPVALEALYRHAHSFKGISAMVGLREAEELAHRAEGSLRVLSRSETTISLPHLDLLGRVTQQLEQIVTAHRLHQPLPDPADLVRQLESYEVAAASRPITSATPPPVVGTPVSSSAAPPPEPMAVETPGRPRLAWRASFAPSADLDKRGVNINTVRARLAELGEIVSAAPLIQSGGRMSFEFGLSLREVPASLEGWADDGILLQPAAIDSISPSAAMDNTAEPVGGAAPSSMFVAPSHIVRVDLSRLDDLM